MIFVFSGIIFGKIKSEYLNNLFSLCLGFDTWSKKFAKNSSAENAKIYFMIKNINEKYDEKLSKKDSPEMCKDKNNECDCSV